LSCFTTTYRKSGYFLEISVIVAIQGGSNIVCKHLNSW
jgi:hypothetical protein